MSYTVVMDIVGRVAIGGGGMGSDIYGGMLWIYGGLVRWGTGDIENEGMSWESCPFFTDPCNPHIWLPDM